MLKCVVRESEEQCVGFHHIESMAVKRSILQHRSLLCSECEEELAHKHHREGAVLGILASIVSH